MKEIKMISKYGTKSLETEINKELRNGWILNQQIICAKSPSLFGDICYTAVLEKNIVNSHKI